MAGHYGRQGVVEPDLLGDIHPGDLNQGHGVSSSQLGNPNVSLDEGSHHDSVDARDRASKTSGENFIDNLTGKGGKNTGKGSSLMVWAVVAIVLVLVKMVSERAGEAREFATVRIGLENWFIVTGLAATGLYVLHVGSALVPSKGKFAQAFREFAGAT